MEAVIPQTEKRSETVIQTATTPTNPAATCPEWCSGGWHQNAVPDERGGWEVMHASTPARVVTDEPALPTNVVVEVLVSTEDYACETELECRPRSVFLKAVDVYEHEESFNLTARQALRLAEVLVQQASAVLAERAAEKIGVDR